MPTNNMCIYISSFDGYADVWDVFFDIFFKFWPDCPFKIYLVNNCQEYKRNGCEVIHTGEEINWFHRTITSLEKIQEDYILFLLEDDFISKNVNVEDLEKLVEYMKNDNIYYCRLTRAKNLNYGNQISQVPLNRRYAISLQPAIWDRKKFLEIICGINGKTPWDFEHYYMDYSNYNTYDGKHIADIRYDGRDILGNKNGILRGKWFPDVVGFYKSKGIEIETETRGILTKTKFIKYRLALWASTYLPKPLQTITKSTMNKMGINYL